jgi:hypothetical protein
MASPLEATRLAMNAVTDATPDERRQRLMELYAAAVALRDLTTRYHDWLVTEDAWLDEHAAEYPPNDPGFLAREEKYLRRVIQYQEAMDVLSAAYEMVRDESRSVSVSRPKVKQGVWRQLGEAPF